jgi:2-hydroxy-6-oxonona-2,4-dienedioate hydrolase
MPFLASNGFRVYAPDFPGYGLSDNRTEYWPVHGVHSHVQFMLDFADAMCLDKMHMSGNSMGCNNIVQFMLKHPERVASVALIAGGVGDIVDPSKRVAGKLDVAALNNSTFNGTKESMRALMEPIMYRKTAISDDLLEMRTRAANRQTESLLAYQAFPRMAANDPNWQQKATTINKIDRITIPAIYLYGKDDVLLPVENGYHQEDACANIQFFYPEECGHQGQTDQPDMFNQVLLEFFRDGRVSRKTADWAGVSKRRAELPHVVEQAVAAAV